MDGALSSDRHDNRRYDSYGGPRRGGRGGRGGGRHNNRRHHPYRREDYGGGRHNRDNRRYDRDIGGYNGRGGGGRRDRQPANRFSTETKSVDPQYAMMKQLTAMVAKMGDLGGAADAASGAGGTNGEVRPVVEAITRNVQDLVAVLCSANNAGLFLRFGEDEASQPENESTEPTVASQPKVSAATDAGPLATLLHSCATNLPLQTPSYAALALGVECTAPASHAGFITRCVELGMRCLGRDLDLMLECKLVGKDDATNEKEERERCEAEKNGGFGNGMQIDAYYRAKLMLRFLAHLANVGMVARTQDQHQNDGNNLSLLGLLQLLVQCACNAASASSSGGRPSLRRASVILTLLVLSTIPFLDIKDYGTSIDDLIEDLETHVLGQSYSSDYEPGVGWQAILLKGELDDGETMDDDDEEEEEDDDGDSPTPSCADTVQDLMRTVRKFVNMAAQNDSAQSRFALLRDAPWKSLKIAASTDGMEVEEGRADNMTVMVYSREPLLLDLVGPEQEKRCECVPYILGGAENDSMELNCRFLGGIVFGRLAIFDAPPDPDDDEEEEEEEGAKKDPNLETYVNAYSLIDRFFLADAIRDVLMCHRPMVSDAGADRSAAKEVAEQIWMVSHLLYPATPQERNEDEMNSTDNSDVSKGVEYGIVETLLSLIVQATPRECGMPAASALNQHLYLARVLLELTKLKPDLVPRAIVRAISGMYEDFIPSLTPTARDNLATWLAIHLFNTEYQWPKSFWDHWASHVTAGPKRNSRGDFVTVVLRSMAGLSSDGAVAIVKDCLPAGSALVQSVFLTTNEETPSSAEQDIADRLWNANHDPESVRQFVISDELVQQSDAIEDGSEDHTMFHRSVWWRTGLVARALLHPSIRDKEREERLVTVAIKRAETGDGTTTVDDTDEVDPTEDLLTDLSDAVARFKPVLLAALAKDADAYDSITTGRVDDDQLLLAGEVSILREFENVLPYWDAVTFNVLIQSLMTNKIVSAMSVVTWALGTKSNRAPPSHWWKYVSVAVRNTISSVEGPSTDLGGGIGMIIDDGGNDAESSEAASKRLDEALKMIVPVLKCVVEQGIEVLTAMDGDKKIPPAGADTSEGIKRIFSATLFLLYHSFCSEPPPGMHKLHHKNVHGGLAEMDLGWDKLSAAFQSAGSSCKSNLGTKLLQSLASSFGKMV